LQANKHDQINNIFQSSVDDSRCNSIDTNTTWCKALCAYQSWT